MYKILAKTLFLGKQVIYMPTCHSTNDIAMAGLKKPDMYEGCIVITDNQVAGRGQLGNEWISSPGLNLTFSIVLKPNSTFIREQFFLNMAVSLSILDVLKEILPNEVVNVKWPNDIYVNENKIGGILIENTLRPPFLENATVGLGLNVNQNQFLFDNATSLSVLTGEKFDLAKLLEDLIISLEIRYRQLKSGDFDLIKRDYIKNLLGYNQVRMFYSEHRFKGTIRDISIEGKLKVEVDREIRTFDLKEIRQLRPKR